MLKHLSKVRIEFNALDSRAASAMEFLAQCSSKKSRSSNPSCGIALKRRTDPSPPLVSVTYNNGQEETLDACSLSAREMGKAISKKAELIETEELFKEAGISWPVVIPLEEIELAKRTRFRVIKEYTPN